MHLIRKATPADHDAIWGIFQGVIAAGDAYVFESEMPREEAMAYWFNPKTHSYVAEHEGEVVGCYLIRPNHPGRGAHVANGSYMVSPVERRHGTGRAMVEHSIKEARTLGFRAIQFNIVVSTNEAAVKLWQQTGFMVVGVLPGAFRHATRGYVDAYVMYQQLV